MKILNGDATDSEFFNEHVKYHTFLSESKEKKNCARKKDAKIEIMLHGQVLLTVWLCKIITQPFHLKKKLPVIGAQ